MAAMARKALQTRKSKTFIFNPYELLQAQEVMRKQISERFRLIKTNQLMNKQKQQTKIQSKINKIQFCYKYLKVKNQPIITHQHQSQHHPMQQTVSQQVKLKSFSAEKELDWIVDVLRKQLAEPYSIYTYNYFLTNWPELTIMAYYKDEIIGCIIGNYDTTNPKKAYIAMLVVLKEYRRLKIGQKLFDQFYKKVQRNVDKIVLQTECINTAALKFYTKLGFFKTRRMQNYYLSGNDAFRLKLYIPKEEQQKKEC